MVPNHASQRLMYINSTIICPRCVDFGEEGKPDHPEKNPEEIKSCSRKTRHTRRSVAFSVHHERLNALTVLMIFELLSSIYSDSILLL